MGVGEMGINCFVIVPQGSRVRDLVGIVLVACTFLMLCWSCFRLLYCVTVVTEVSREMFTGPSPRTSLSLSRLSR